MLIAASIYLIGFFFAIFLHFDTFKLQVQKADIQELATFFTETKFEKGAFETPATLVQANFNLVEAVFKALLWPIHFLIFLISEWVKSVIAVLVN